MAQRHEPTSREVSNTLTLMAIKGPWGIYGLFDYFDDHDESEWEPHYDKCLDCRGKGYHRKINGNFIECETCNTSGSLLVAIHLKNQKEAPPLYLGDKLREVLMKGTDLRFAISPWYTGRKVWAVIPALHSWLNPDLIPASEREYLEETRWQDGPLQAVY